MKSNLFIYTFTVIFLQDCIDLVLGNYIVNTNESASLPCPLEVKPALKYFMVNTIFVSYCFIYLIE